MRRSFVVIYHTAIPGELLYRCFPVTNPVVIAVWHMVVFNLLSSDMCGASFVVLNRGLVNSVIKLSH